MSILGLDIGTTGCKCIAFDSHGVILAHAYREYNIETPKPGWAEQDAEQVLRLALDCLREVIVHTGSDVPLSVALSCQGEAVIPVNSEGKAIRNAILGMDTRTGHENQWLEKTFGADALFLRTGMPIHTINTLPKLLWIKENEPEIFKEADQFLLYEDFLIRRLTGKAVISHCMASRTQMYSLKTHTWDEEILTRCGIELRRLAVLASETNGVVETMLPDIQREIGASKAILVASGGHDQACAALGSGVITPGKAMVSTGTAEVVEVVMDTPVLDKKLQDGKISVYRHVVPGLYLAMTLNHCGGLLLRWYRDTFCDSQVMQAKNTDMDPYTIILKDAPQGPTHLFVLPHFAGSGTPWLDTESRGAILGLQFSDDRTTVAKAILEGLTFELRINLDLIKQSGAAIHELHAVGGGAKSPLWLQLKADICQTSLSIPKVTEAACLGAALLGGVACGLYANITDAVKQTVSIEKHVEPDAERVAAYQGKYETYQKIYPALKALMNR